MEVSGAAEKQRGSDFLHGGASWMQISDCRLVGATLKATSHRAQAFWCMLHSFFTANPMITLDMQQNPQIVWRSNKKKCRSLKLSHFSPPRHLFLPILSADSEETCLIHFIHPIIHDMNTKPSWTNSVGIHPNLCFLDSQIQNSRKPPAFKEHSIEEEEDVPAPNRLSFWSSTNGICQLNVSESQNLNQVGLKIHTATP